ncbi:MAG: HPr family phosphocarrier protein [Fibrobacterota bacterium]
MYQKTVKVKNENGLHARPSATLVQEASKFQSEIFIEKSGVTANAKSIMSIMVLAAEFGSDLILRAEGPDEKEAVDSLVMLFDNKFNGASS